MSRADGPRVAVWLDPTAPLESALHVMGGLGTDIEFLGLFIEDTELLSMSSLSVAREITGESRLGVPLSATRVEQQFRREAQRMRRLFENVTNRLKARRSFRTARGELKTELLRLSAGCDALVLSHSRHHFGRRMVTRTQLGGLLGDGPPTLVIVQERWRTGEQVVAVFDGSPASEAALHTARTISVAEGIGMSVWLPQVTGSALAKLEVHAATTLGERVDYEFTRVDLAHVDGLISAARHDNIRAIVLPDTVSQVTREQIAALLDRVSCSLIVVRQGPS